METRNGYDALKQEIRKACAALKYARENVANPEERRRAQAQAASTAMRALKTAGAEGYENHDEEFFYAVFWALQTYDAAIDAHRAATGKTRRVADAEETAQIFHECARVVEKAMKNLEHADDAARVVEKAAKIFARAQKQRRAPGRRKTQTQENAI